MAGVRTIGAGTTAPKADCSSHQSLESRVCAKVETQPSTWAPKSAVMAGTGRDWPFPTAIALLSVPPRAFPDDGAFLDLNAGEGMTWDAAIGLAADVAGIFDPTPVCDGVSALQSLAHGDFYGVALSAGSAAVPYAGDALAKPIKVAARYVNVSLTGMVTH